MKIMPPVFSGPASGKGGGKQLALVPARAQPPVPAPVVGAAPAAPAVDRTSTAIASTDRYTCFTKSVVLRLFMFALLMGI